MNSEITEREIGRLNLGRLIRAEVSVLLPLFLERRELIIGRLTAAFRSGDRDAVFAVAAELAITEEMSREIKRRLTETEHLERKANGITGNGP